MLIQFTPAAFIINSNKPRIAVDMGTICTGVMKNVFYGRVALKKTSVTFYLPFNVRPYAHISGFNSE